MFATLAIPAAPACAQVNPGEPNPSVWLGQIYDLYHRAEKTKSLASKANTDLVEKRASKSLAALFKKERDCGRKTHEVCALDWDYVIDGQDWALSNVKVGAFESSGDKGTVKVGFTNLDATCANVFYFVRENGQWRVEDVETQSGSDAPLRITKILKDYKY